MSRLRYLAPLVLVVHAAAAQKPRAATPAAVADTARATDDEGVREGLQYGIAAGALRYGGGRTEESIGGIVRWAPVHFFSIAASPSFVRQRIGASATAAGPTGNVRGATARTSATGLADIPVFAELTHAFSVSHDPVVSFGMGASLPVGDSASGFGSGQFGYSADVGLGVSPTDKTWLDADFGRSISGFTPQSAFSGASGWVDLGAGVTVNTSLSLNGGFSTDVGAVDPVDGRSSSASGGVAIGLGEATTLNFAVSHGVSGAAPSWSFSLGVGTAFPSLGHLGGSAALGTLRRTFGGGTHGLKKGIAGGATGRGKGKT